MASSSAGQSWLSAGKCRHSPLQWRGLSYLWASLSQGSSECTCGISDHVEIIFFSTPTPAANARRRRRVLKRNASRVKQSIFVVGAPALFLASDDLSDFANDVLLVNEAICEWNVDFAVCSALPNIVHKTTRCLPSSNRATAPLRSAAVTSDSDKGSRYSCCRGPRHQCCRWSCG
jgi:hypothetical protein